MVFVRLYWFERKFQKIVREARNLRRTKSRTRTEGKEDTSIDTAEKGIRGRSIVVLRTGDTGSRNAGNNVQNAMFDPAKEGSDDCRTGSSTSNREANEAVDTVGDLPSQPLPTLRREITFADEVDRDDFKPNILPQRLSPEEHIEFLENQRNPKDKGALRIPGPRDFERGSVPEPLNADYDDDDQLSHRLTSPIERQDMLREGPIKRNVTLDEPDHPHSRAFAATFSKLSNSKSATSERVNKAPTDDNMHHSNRLKARTGTFSSLRGLGSKENEPPTPYLSYQPTIGRNSAFVDLTEEQREELGGIEYRSLKTLAVVLVGKCDVPSECGRSHSDMQNQCSILRIGSPSGCNRLPSLDHLYRHLGPDC